MAIKAKTASSIDRPILIHPGFLIAGSTLLIAAFVSDLLFWRTALFQWANFSVWLITGGLLLALVAGIALLLDVALGRAGAISWGRFTLLAAVALLSLLNAFVHSRDAWTSVIPEGLILSGIVTVLLLINSWGGWSLVAGRMGSTEANS